MVGDSCQNSEENEQIPALSLPIELLIHIFRFLNFSDLKSARLVCHSWYEASQDPKIIDKEIVNFSGNGAPSGSLASLVPNLTSSYREFLHFLFKEEEVRWDWPGLWEHIAPRIKSLHFFNCDMRERDFINILLMCKSLESLQISGCRELLMSGGLLRDQEVVQLKDVLVNLKNLGVYHNSYLSDALLNRFIAIAPNLQSISLEGCQNASPLSEMNRGQTGREKIKVLLDQSRGAFSRGNLFELLYWTISFHVGLYNKFYPKHSAEGIRSEDKGNINEVKAMESTSILTFRNILYHITTKSHQLHTLRFGHTLIDSQALRQLAKVPDLKLQTLTLAGCEQLTNAGIVGLTEYQNTLRTLDLSCCSRVTDPSMIAICHTLPHLKNLCVRRCRAISDIGVSEVQNLKNLVKLDISNCDMVTSDGIITGLCSNQNWTLRQLYLSGINNMTEDTIVKLAQHLINLTHLDLSYCITAVTDMALQALFKNQIWLRYLKLSGCNKVTDAGLTGMVTHTPLPGVESPLDFPHNQFDEANLASSIKSQLRISLKSRAEEEIVRDAERKKAILQLFQDSVPSTSASGCSVSRLKGLQSLNLSGCTRITDISLSHAFKFLELKYLDLTQCCQITHSGLTALALNNPSLESLILSMCYNVSDDAVVALCKYLKRLDHLDLSACEKLTNTSLESIAENCKTLRHLDMRRCHRLVACPDGLLDHIPSLMIPSIAVGPEDDLSPPPPVPPMLKRRS